MGMIVTVMGAGTGTGWAQAAMATSAHAAAGAALMMRDRVSRAQASREYTNVPTANKILAILGKVKVVIITLVITIIMNL